MPISGYASIRKGYFIYNFNTLSLAKQFIFMKKIGVLIGSLRKDSYNKKIAENFIKLAPASLSFEVIEIGNLPLYNEDLEIGNIPSSWINFRTKIQNLDGVIFFTPEYNRSIPGALKNALDVGSRPSGQSAWAGKAGAVISISTGGLSAFGANHVLRQSMVSLNVPMMQQPEGYIGNVKNVFDENGNLVEGTARFLTRFAEAFAKWVHLISH